MMYLNLAFMHLSLQFLESLAFPASPSTADPQTQTGAPAISVCTGVGVASLCFMLCPGVPNSSMLLLSMGRTGTYIHLRACV